MAWASNRFGKSYWGRGWWGRAPEIIEKFVSDVGEGLEGIAPTVKAFASDVGKGAETILTTVKAFVADLGEGVDSVTTGLRVFIKDAGEAIEAVAVPLVRVFIKEAGHGLDVVISPLKDLWKRGTRAAGKIIAPVVGGIRTVMRVGGAETKPSSTIVGETLMKGSVAKMAPSASTEGKTLPKAKGTEMKAGISGVETGVVTPKIKGKGSKRVAAGKTMIVRGKGKAVTPKSIRR